MRRIVASSFALIMALAGSCACAGNAVATAAPTPATSADAPAPAASAASGKVVVSGSVPDEATHAAIIKKLRAVYGLNAVKDELTVDSVVAPAQWTSYVEKLITPGLKEIHHGKLDVNGNTVRFSGNVANEAQRQQIVSKAAGHLNPTYTVKNALAVKAPPAKQHVLDSALDNRTIQFKSGSAVLTNEGRHVLDQMAVALKKIGPTRVEISGNTDNVGSHRSNVELSINRASAVKAYLVKKGIDAGNLSVMGYGPDRPIASNTTAAGRARNRRIDFRVVKRTN